jgi:hypothetical protein
MLVRIHNATPNEFSTPFTFSRRWGKIQSIMVDARPLAALPPSGFSRGCGKVHSMMADRCRPFLLFGFPETVYFPAVFHLIAATFSVIKKNTDNTKWLTVFID